MEAPMRIGIIGGGKRCEAFLEMLGTMRFPRLKAQIVAVADPNDHAVGIRHAREMGIYTTTDFRDFHRIENLDLVINLTGREELLEDFLTHYPAKVRVLESAISRMFADILRYRGEYICRERQYEIIEGIIDSIFFSIRDWVLLLSPDRRILDANEAFLREMGLGKEQVVGRYCHEVSHQSLHECGGEGFFCPLKESVLTGSVAHSIHEHLDGSGQVRYCEITTVPLKGAEGSVEIVIEIVRDITNELERRIDEKTRAFKRDLARLIHEDKMIALGKLVASAVHEINNPLSGIHALARLMYQEIQDGDMTGERMAQFKYYLQLIDTESARCSNIVSNLLSFSRQSKVEHKPFQLNEVIARALLLSRHKMGLQQIEVHQEPAEDLPEMQGDPGQILQVILNLLFNAMEAMPEGGEINISTVLEPEKDRIHLQIADQGVGIPGELMSQIFEPFFSTKSQDKGVGLGLSVVYGIVKEHKGDIYVQSKVGEGSRFSLWFPVAKPHTV